MPKQDARYGYHPWIALISLVGAGFILLAYVLWSAYQDVWAEARSVASSQAELLEARFDATLRRCRIDLDDMAARPCRGFPARQRGAPGRRSRQNWSAPAMPFPRSSVSASSMPTGLLYRSGGGEYANLADRAYFRMLKDNGAAGLVFFRGHLLPDHRPLDAGRGPRHPFC